MTLAQVLAAALVASLWLSWYLAESREELKREVQVLRGIRARRQPGTRMPWEISSASYEWKVFVAPAPEQESVLVKLRKGSGDGIRIATVRVLDDDFDEQLAKAQARGEDQSRP